MTERNPRYVHTKLLSGSGYTPEPVNAPQSWFEQRRPDVYPIELVQGDDWALLEQSEDLSPASHIQIAMVVIKGLQHIRDTYKVILWDIKPEHVMVQGFCPPDEVSHIAIKFVDLETIYLVEKQAFSTLGEPTPFTLNSIARQQSILVQGGVFEPEVEIIDSMIDYIRVFTAASHCPAPEINQALAVYWSKTITCNFENFLACLQKILREVVKGETADGRVTK